VLEVTSEAFGEAIHLDCPQITTVAHMEDDDVARVTSCRPTVVRFANFVITTELPCVRSASSQTRLPPRSGPVSIHVDWIDDALLIQLGCPINLSCYGMLNSKPSSAFSDSRRFAALSGILCDHHCSTAIFCSFAFASTTGFLIPQSLCFNATVCILPSFIA
jgi:hypothetical protein